MAKVKTKQVKKIEAKENKFFSEKMGFIPNTPKEEIIKHFARIIADKKLDNISINENITIAYVIPVWPQRYKGGEIKYYKKDGVWKYSFMSGLLLKRNDDLGYNNVPNTDDFINDDFDEFLSQFLVIKSSDSKRIPAGHIAFLHPRSTKTGVSFFKYKGETLAVINTMNLM
jgi:hypothetical protein